jgi:hypothetical protein
MRIDGKITRGVVAGLAGGAALALWFLAVDAVAGEPFATPRFVARTLAGLDGGTGVATLAVYTILHFAVFAAVGVAAAWLFDAAAVPASFMLGLVLGFLLFDFVFYAGLVMSGTNITAALGWPEVLVGNLIAGLTVVRVIRITGPEEVPRLRDILRDHDTIREGVVGGLLGALAVMVWFLLLDVVRGQLFFTPAALGSALFHGARGTAEVVLTVPVVLGYTGIHLVAFLGVGLVASAMVEGARREPPLLLAMVLFFVTLEVMFIGWMAIMAIWLLESLSWWTVVVANLIAAGVMGGYLLYEHPEIRENLSHDLEEEQHQETV